jgi:preprotein translocase subunit YajC
MSDTGYAISVATGVLQRGDRIMTTDGIHAIVLRIDARDPKVGRWAECLTDNGQTLRFAATPDLTVTLLPGP